MAPKPKHLPGAKAKTGATEAQGSHPAFPPRIAAPAAKAAGAAEEAKKAKEADGCAICLVAVRRGPVGRLACGHDFHLHCLKRWAGRETTCPQCKVRFSEIASYVRGCLKEVEAVPERTLAANGGPRPVCVKCDTDDRGEVLLLCDGKSGRCSTACHTHCAGLAEVPEDKWFCDTCCARAAVVPAAFRKVSQLTQISPKLDVPRFASASAAAADFPSTNYLERFAKKRKSHAVDFAARAGGEGADNNAPAEAAAATKRANAPSINVNAFQYEAEFLSGKL